MKINKKYIIALITALAIQFGLGVNFANAVPCENLLKAAWDEATYYTVDFDHDKGLFRNGDRVKEVYLSAYPRWVIAKTYEDALSTFPSLPINFSEYYIKSSEVAGCVSEAESIYSYERTLTSNHSKLKTCLTDYLIQNRCDVSAFKNSGSSKKANQKSSSSSDQSSNSGSSNQANSDNGNNQSSSNKSNQNSAGQFNEENYASMDDNSLISAYNFAVKENQPDKEFKALLELANRGNVTGQFNLGVRYANGDGTKQDFAKAMYWYEQAAKKRHAGASFNLGNMYYKGLGVTADEKKAFGYWYNAALENDLDAITQVGEAFYYGIGTSKNEYSANSYTEQAAKKGHPRAIENLKKFDY